MLLDKPKLIDRPKLLVIDDEWATLNFMEQALPELGFEVTRQEGPVCRLEQPAA